MMSIGPGADRFQKVAAQERIANVPMNCYLDGMDRARREVVSLQSIFAEGIVRYALTPLLALAALLGPDCRDR